MTLYEIEVYLKEQHDFLQENILTEIEKLRHEAISNKDEEKANYCWCIRQIYYVQKNYLLVYDSLRKQEYEEAWRALEQTDIKLSFLEENFDIGTIVNDIYNLLFIKRIIKEYEKLFPYQFFTSREGIIKQEKCSICGKIVSLRHGCGHKIGKLYMGEMCSHIVTDYELISISIVKDPFDKYAIIKPEGMEYNYEMLDFLMNEIHSPYDAWFVETLKIVKPEYKKIGRNDICPCKSGRKYKRCCYGTENIYTDHYRINLLNQKARNIQSIKFTSTWK